MAVNPYYEQGFYQTGTATVAANGTIVTGQGTLWSQIVAPGDDFGKHVGLPIPIKNVISDTQIELAYPWPGPAQTAAPYRITFTPYHVAFRQTMQMVLEILKSGNNSALAGLTGAADMLPIFTGPGAMDIITKSELVNGVRFDVQVDGLSDRAAYDNEDTGFTVLVADIGDGRSAVYSKNSNDSGDWSDPAYITGPRGHESYVYIAYASNASGAGFTMTFNPSLNYIAIKTTETPIANPSASDFAGLWFNYKGATGATGATGAPGADWLTGSADPAAGIGVDGDLYLQTANGSSGSLGDVWQKAGGTWSVVANIRGVSGDGSGDVTGPNGGLSDGEVPLFDGTTGKILKGSGLLGSAIGNMKGPASSTVDRLVAFSDAGGKNTKDSGLGTRSVVGHPSVTTNTTDFNNITAPGFHSELCRGGSGYCPNSPQSPAGAYWVVENQVYSATTITQFAWPYGPNLVSYPNMGVMVRHRFSGTWTSWQSLITGRYQEVHAIIRAQSNGTWVLLNDTDHTPIGAASVSQSSTGITLHFDFTATKVHSFIVALDETMAKERVHCGASVALNSAFIQLFETSSTPVDPSLYANPSANLWVTGKFTV